MRFTFTNGGRRGDFSRGYTVLLWALLLGLLASPLARGQRALPSSSSTAGAAEALAPTLTIIPSHYADDAFLGAQFHVLFHNPSDKPLNLFDEKYSWGYFGLSFIVTYPDGRVEHVKKKMRGWDKNAPVSWTIGPKGYYVFDVLLDPNIWTKSVLMEKSGVEGRKCRLQAVYSIEPSPESVNKAQWGGPEGVWTGTIRSEERAFVVF
jgi:hypothetical protein